MILTRPGFFAFAALMLLSSQPARALMQVVDSIPVTLPDSAPPKPAVRIVTFGDSNTDFGWSGTDSTKRVASYLSCIRQRLRPAEPNSPLQLAGKIEAQWKAVSAEPILVVNHSIAGSSTGIGNSCASAPNPREAVTGTTRFAAEVLGAAYPWNGGERLSRYYRRGPVVRVQAFVPDSNDYAYVSLGTNDSWYGMTPEETAENLCWMIGQWTGAGHSASHFLLTTLPPRAYDEEGAIPRTNKLIRALAASTGVRLIDIATRTSDDEGITWRVAADHVGDSIHYSEAVRDWIAEQVVGHVRRSR